MWMQIKLLYRHNNFSLYPISPGQLSMWQRTVRTVRTGRSAKPDRAQGLWQRPDSLPALLCVWQRVQRAEANGVVVNHPRHELHFKVCRRLLGYRA
jgi:hypothetical protein